jgi:maltose alpha-D-glucosyltransferase/alpha-amylase
MRAREQELSQVIPDLWYKNTVVYSLDVETFMDGNGDGCGDFEGLIRRLEYLQSLGVGAVWLGPFQPTPNRDNGYDVADFYGVDPRLGSLGDFVEFVHEARSRGIRVLADLVVNHTSDRHPWFRRASEDRDSPFHDWYVWSKKRPPHAKMGMVFPGVQERTWTYARGVRKWYFHRFHEFEPDLDTHHPEVREEIRRIMGFWLELGVAGFRVDAVPFVLEKPSPDGGESTLAFDHLHEMRAFLQWRVGDAILLGEANVHPDKSRDYFAGGNGLHMMFNFWVNQHLFYALASGEARPLAQALRATRRLPATAQWGQFLRNHDELDLGRLQEKQRAAVFEEFGPEARMQLYGRGLRRRLAPMLGDRLRLNLAYSLMFSLPGTPVLYYGEEIGMGENLRLRGRTAVRTPMQWSGDPNAGFSTADDLVNPVVQGGPYGYESLNAEAQQRDSDSLLRWMIRLIRLRTECPEIGWGEWRVVPTRSAHVLALFYRWRGNRLVCIHNFDAHPTDVRLDLGEDGGDPLASLIDDDMVAAGGRGAYRVSLPAYGYRWYRLGHRDFAPSRRVP